MRAEVLRHFALDPSVTFLNHGSFGACPRVVLEHQGQLRERMEREPVQFLARDLERLLDEARAALAAYVKADAASLAFVPNATFGVNAVVWSLVRGAGDGPKGHGAAPGAPFIGAGDEIVTTDHDYNACRNVLVRAAESVGARVVVAHLPVPLTKQAAIDAVLGAITPKTRLVMIDHVTSPTAAVLPVADITREAEARGVRVLVDGAHAPGQLDLDVNAIGASYYTGNCHKWMCAPKGAGFLAVRADRVDEIRPAITSHGANSWRTDRERFLIEFDWTGTSDPSPWLSIQRAIAALPEIARACGLVDARASDADAAGAIRAHNRALALDAGRLLADALSESGARVEPLCADDMCGSMRALPLWDASEADQQAMAQAHRAFFTQPLQQRLFEEHKIEVPISTWPRAPKRLVRLSAQLYNEVADYEKLAGALRSLRSR